MIIVSAQTHCTPSTHPTKKETYAVSLPFVIVKIIMNKVVKGVHLIGVGRFRILGVGVGGGGARFRILGGGARGGRISSRHMTS